MARAFRQPADRLGGVGASRVRRASRSPLAACQGTSSASSGRRVRASAGLPQDLRPAGLHASGAEGHAADPEEQRARRCCLRRVALRARRSPHRLGQPPGDRVLPASLHEFGPLVRYGGSPAYWARCEPRAVAVGPWRRSETDGAGCAFAGGPLGRGSARAADASGRGAGRLGE